LATIRPKSLRDCARHQLSRTHPPLLDDSAPHLHRGRFPLAPLALQPPHIAYCPYTLGTTSWNRLRHSPLAVRGRYSHKSFGLVASATSCLRKQIDKSQCNALIKSC
jgi:hypothetical protein